jgi:hypothetical protein
LIDAPSFDLRFAVNAACPRCADVAYFDKVHAAMSDAEDNPQSKVDTETFRRLERLRDLRIEHRDLDDVINRLQLDLYVNEVQLRRLKKRKLMLKDQIARLESELIPDLNA